MLASDQRKVDRVALLARQYASRFGASIYAETSSKRWPRRWPIPARSTAPTISPSSIAFFAALAPETRRGFLLAVARAAVLDGKFDVVAAASGGTLGVVVADSGDEARCKLYQATARILTPEYDAGLAELQSVSRRQARPVRSGTAGERARHRRLSASAAARRDEPAIPAPAAADAQPDAATQTIALGETSLGRTASLTDANFSAGASDKGSL